MGNGQILRAVHGHGDFLFLRCIHDPTHGLRHGIKEAARFLIQLDHARFQPGGFHKGLKEKVQLELLGDFVDTAPLRESPYLELREYFRLSDKSPLTLTFRQIEQILGDSLPAEAYFYDAFWYENMPGMTSPMWREEGYPFHALIPDEIDYYISDSWTSQGYEIKALHRHDERVVFRRVVTGVSGVRIPRALTARKLPDALVYKLEKLLKQFVRENGL